MNEGLEVIKSQGIVGVRGRWKGTARDARHKAESLHLTVAVPVSLL